MRTSAIAASLLTMALATAPAVAAAPAAGDAAAGERFAEEHCGRCHGTGIRDDSPHAAAPPFRELAGRWPLEYLAEALAEGISVGHPDMPEFVLSPEEIDDLLLYLEGIGETR